MSRQKRRISEAHSPGGKRARNGDPDFSRSSFDSLEYSNGSICEIYLKNFMTHQEYHWRPGAFVNLISGPNGAGKSSILQAIVIALGKKIILFHARIRIFKHIFLKVEELQIQKERQNLRKISNMVLKKRRFEFIYLMDAKMTNAVINIDMKNTVIKSFLKEILQLQQLQVLKLQPLLLSKAAVVILLTAKQQKKSNEFMNIFTSS